MGAVDYARKLARSFVFYSICLVTYLTSVLVITLYVGLVFPVYLWNKPAVVKVTNWMFFTCFNLIGFVFNRSWKCVMLNDLPEDYKKKQRIYMFNHLSSSDPFLVTHIGMKLPLVCTYKDSLHKIPTTRLMMGLSGQLAIKFMYDKANDRKIPVRDSVGKLMKDCKDAMDQGFNLCVYPEGKRSRDGVLQEFKDGFFRFAVEHGVEIQPCAISNSAALWPLKSTFLIGSGLAYINIGKPISPEGKTVEQLKHATRKAIYDALRACPTFNPALETVPELED
ncbi:acyltransferase family protein, putative [Babesia bigemina]|uniref:Acyltransferase family protein, putative n=1 Tax=Babesia bigemina TaxID=5866 RepID=A0A061CZF4_BABBI|nr:acyltransferase family protein, putative [Babesia bigemina]CDR94006.1 acyltransferase family protein, putative [Babesia bigemina]|eukprot:XP_012766192.1 acyltransferase family protein, putative [Babesia bigemina]